jgi:hypothetical protein
MAHNHHNHPRSRHQRVHHLVRRQLLSFVVLLLCSTGIQAIPVTEYHRNLQQAVTALDTFAQADEKETLSDYQQRVTQTLAALRISIPKTQAVESGGEICNVDNSWLHEQLDTFAKSADSERPAIVAQMIERLQAIEERIAEMEKPGVASADKAEANKKLAAILSRSEYAQKVKEGSAIGRLWQEFLRWLKTLLPKRPSMAPGRANLFSALAQIFVVVLAVAVIAYVVRMFAPTVLRARKKKTKGKPAPRIVLGERIDPEESAVDLLSEAEALARRGELRAAIRKAYIALLVELGDRKMISLAQHKTNRDYLRSVSNVPSLHNKMIGLTDSFERHWYGLVQASQTDWQDFRAGYKAALQL